MAILSGVVPSSSATFSLIASTLTGPEASDFLSPRSTAKTVAPLVSARNSNPSGPNAIGPADFHSGEPLTRPAALATLPATDAAMIAAERIRIARMGRLLERIERGQDRSCSWGTRRHYPRERPEGNEK